MNEIEIHNPGTMSLPDKMRYASALAEASLLPRAYQKQPGNVLLAMELGDALGIRPIQAINAVHVIEGKPSASADLIASLIRKAGHKLRVRGNDQEATAEIIRADDPDYTFSVTWTLDRARVAGLLGKGVWKNYPAAMLKARAITEVAREGASDALYGVIYTPEELGASVDSEGEPLTASVRATNAAPRGSSRVHQAMAQEAAPEPAPMEDLGERPNRDFLAEAEDADGDPDLLRALWKAARAAGEPEAHLNTIQAMAVTDAPAESTETEAA